MQQKIQIISVFISIILILQPGLSIAKTHKINYSLNFNLASSDATFIGEGEADSLGDSVAIIGDVNGDGLDDILMGARRNDQSGPDAGKTYLIFGKKDGWQNDTAVEDADASFIGENEYDKSGGAVAGIGDVNGDGLDDFIIGADEADVGETYSGIVYLFFGRSSGWSKDVVLSESDASFIGAQAFEHAGSSLAGVGDVNRDGYDDILIGAPQSDDDRSLDQRHLVGRTYLILGHSDGWKENMSLVDADASFIGENEEDYAGRTIAGAGDVNGDGYDDMLITAKDNDEGGDDAGQVYLIFGRNIGWGMDYNLSMSDASFIGEKSNASLGFSLAGAGDVNRDGYKDFLISAVGMDTRGPYTGKIYLVFGKADGWSMDTIITEADASFVGQNMSFCGGSVSGAGDVNSDSYDDILIGAPSDNVSGVIAAGLTYLILGKSSGWAKDVNITNADASFLGENEFDWAGLPIAGGGDVNGDGFNDILIGARDNDESGSNAGQVYLILMRNKQYHTTVEMNYFILPMIIIIIAVVVIILIYYRPRDPEKKRGVRPEKADASSGRQTRYDTNRKSCS